MKRREAGKYKKWLWERGRTSKHHVATAREQVVACDFQDVQRRRAGGIQRVMRAPEFQLARHKRGWIHFEFILSLAIPGFNDLCWVEYVSHVIFKVFLVYFVVEFLLQRVSWERQATAYDSTAPQAGLAVGVFRGAAHFSHPCVLQGISGQLQQQLVLVFRFVVDGAIPVVVELVRELAANLGHMKFFVVGTKSICRDRLRVQGTFV